MRLQGGDRAALLGQQQQRQDSRHPQQRPVRTGHSPGALQVQAVLLESFFRVSVILILCLLCSQQATARCRRDCSCEQKYKWHRLLAYDPNNDCAGVFMDWFLFPACCSCRSDTAVTCFLFIHCDYSGVTITPSEVRRKHGQYSELLALNSSWSIRDIYATQYSN